MYRTGSLRREKTHWFLTVFMYAGVFLIMYSVAEYLFEILGLSFPLFGSAKASALKFPIWTSAVVGIGAFMFLILERLDIIAHELREINSVIGNILKEPEDEYAEPSFRTIKRLRAKLVPAYEFEDNEGDASA